MFEIYKKLEIRLTSLIQTEEAGQTPTSVMLSPTRMKMNRPKTTSPS